MRSLLRGLLLVCGLLTPIHAIGETITYRFDLSGLNNDAANFSLELQSNGYITTTGIAPLATAQATPFGFDITRAGANSVGWFLFASDLDDQIGAYIDDTVITYTSQSFSFFPDLPLSGFIQSPDVFAGSVSGNANGDNFFGDATLTVTAADQTAVTPEPASLVLLCSGALAAGTGAWRRRRSALR